MGTWTICVLLALSLPVSTNAANDCAPAPVKTAFSPPRVSAELAGIMWFTGALAAEKSNRSVPTLTAVGPVKLFGADSTKPPKPFLMRPAEPLMPPP